MEQIIAEILFLLLGGVAVARPDIYLAFQVWSQRVILGATYTPSPRTCTIIRFVGVFLLLISFGFFTGIIEPSSKNTSATHTEKTFCEDLINIKRLTSSSAIVSGLDVPEDEYYARGIVSAPIDFDGKYPEAKNFKTAITKAVFEGSGPNFAGHYTVASWGCGSNCQSHAVVDNNTGEIVSYGLGSEYGVEHSLDSKLLILNPVKLFPTLEESGMSPYQAMQTFARIPREYYLLEYDESTKEPFVRLFCTESAGSHYIK